MNKPITQDTETLVLKKKVPQKMKVTETVTKFNAAKNKNVVSDVNAKKLETEEVGKIETVSHSLSLQIQKARLNKKMTQKELAKKLNIPLNTIQNYENGKGVPKGPELQKIGNILGVTLKKNK